MNYELCYVKTFYSIYRTLYGDFHPSPFGNNGWFALESCKCLQVLTLDIKKKPPKVKMQQVSHLLNDRVG